MSHPPLLGPSILFVESSLSHSDVPHSVGLLWTSDQSDAKNSTCNTQLSQETDFHDSGGIRTPIAAIELSQTQTLDRAATGNFSKGMQLM